MAIEHGKMLNTREVKVKTTEGHTFYLAALIHAVGKRADTGTHTRCRLPYKRAELQGSSVM